MKRVLILAGLAAAVSACSTTPTVTKQRMTLGEANIEGMECRVERPIGSVVPRTVCASPQAWANFDKAAAYETSLARQAAREVNNVGAFNRR